jgi:anti-sigma regulatory factor (Ser/Thr protein kinase)
MTGQQQIRHCLRSGETEICCELENDLPLLSAFTQELREAIGERGLFDEFDSLKFVSAVDEALMNAYFHGNLEIDSKLRENGGDEYHDLAKQRKQQPPWCTRRIHFRARIAADQVVITIRDDGSGFDPERLPNPTAPEQLERPFGRGLLLMRAFTDDMRFNDLGNEVTLVKRTD